MGSDPAASTREFLLEKQAAINQADHRGSGLGAREEVGADAGVRPNATRPTVSRKNFFIILHFDVDRAAQTIEDSAKCRHRFATHPKIFHLQIFGRRAYVVQNPLKARLAMMRAYASLELFCVPESSALASF